LSSGAPKAPARGTSSKQTARAQRGRVIGVDLGSRRIGVAVSDDGRQVASALSVLERGSSHAEDHTGLARIVAETGANLVVVGLPLSLDGSEGPAASAVRAEVDEMRLVIEVPVECADERFTTVVAHQGLAAMGGRRPTSRRAMVDKVAAAAILQTWLDCQRARAWPEPARAQSEQWRGEAVARRTSRRAR